MERRNIKYRSPPILTIGDYRHATVVDGVPKRGAGEEARKWGEQIHRRGRKREKEQG